MNTITNPTQFGNIGYINNLNEDGNKDAAFNWLNQTLTHQYPNNLGFEGGSGGLTDL